MRLSVH